MFLRGWNPVFRVWAVLLCCATGLLVGCSESRDPDVTIAVAGTVRDGSGEPVSGARVAVAYQYDPAAPNVSAAELTLDDREWVIPIDLKETTDWTLEITDYRGDHVRTFTGHDAGRVDVTWDGTDDDDRPVPDGVYICTVEAGDLQAAKMLRLAAGCDGMSGSEAYLELADSRGVYGIDWDIIPLGERFVSLDEYGPDTTWVSDTIRVCAWKDGATGSVETVLQRSGTISVDVIIE